MSVCACTLRHHHSDTHAKHAPPFDIHPQSLPAFAPFRRTARHRSFYLWWINEFRHWWKSSRLLVRLAGLFTLALSLEYAEKMTRIDPFKHKKKGYSEKRAPSPQSRQAVGPWWAHEDVSQQCARLYAGLANSCGCLALD